MLAHFALPSSYVYFCLLRVFMSTSVNSEFEEVLQLSITLLSYPLRGIDWLLFDHFDLYLSMFVEEEAPGICETFS